MSSLYEVLSKKASDAVLKLEDARCAELIEKIISRKPMKQIIPKIGNWSLVDVSDIRNGHQMWTVKCVCGKVKSVRESDLKRGHSTGCGRKTWVE